MSLANWVNFYVIVGSSAAALTGLMFVAIALMTNLRVNLQARSRLLDAFGTPTVVHFGAVLMQSAILSAPWPTLGGARVALAVYAWTAVTYTTVVVRRTRRQTDYQPVLEDWLFHAVLPLMAYLSVATAVTALARYPATLLFVVGGAAVLLLFVGIHNAWDTVTYVVSLEWERRPSDTDVGVTDQHGS